MKIKLCAVICEFNPFHNGHEYLLETAKETSGCDAILCVMSGNFVQRAECACIDKYSRTHAALKHGAGIVAELPVIYSAANANLFSKGAIDIITQFSSVTHIAFGCEDDNIELLQTLSSIAAKENDSFKNKLKEYLSQGFSYAKSYALSLSFEAQNYGFDSSMCDIVLSKPNNLLAIEYLKHLKIKNSSIIPVPVKRKGSGYNDKTLKKNFSSATAIRELIYSNNINSICDNIPGTMFDLIMKNLGHIPDINIFNALVLHSLKTNDLSELPDSGEGLEIKLKKNALYYSDLNTVLEKTKSKRYTYAKIKRMALQSLLCIKKDSIVFPAPVKLLGIKKEFKSEIKAFPASLIIQNSDYKKLGRLYDSYIETEKKAAAVYSLITKSDGDGFYNNKLIEV